jgi:hypothetical protein
VLEAGDPLVDVGESVADAGELVQVGTAFAPRLSVCPGGTPGGVPTSRTDDAAHVPRQFVRATVTGADKRVPLGFRGRRYLIQSLSAETRRSTNSSTLPVFGRPRSVSLSANSAFVKLS